MSGAVEGPDSGQVILDIDELEAASGPSNMASDLTVGHPVTAAPSPPLPPPPPSLDGREPDKKTQ